MTDLYREINMHGGSVINICLIGFIWVRHCSSYLFYSNMQNTPLIQPSSFNFLFFFRQRNNHNIDKCLIRIPTMEYFYSDFFTLIVLLNTTLIEMNSVIACHSHQCVTVRAHFLYKHFKQIDVICNNA